MANRTRQPTKDLRSEVRTFSVVRSEHVRDGYLNRLRYLLRLRRDHSLEMNDLGLRLIDQSIFSTYCDCIDIGQKEAAREILREVRLRLYLPS